MLYCSVNVALAQKGHKHLCNVPLCQFYCIVLTTGTHTALLWSFVMETL